MVRHSLIIHNIPAILVVEEYRKHTGIEYVMNADENKQARALLLRARSYRFFAAVFLAVGVIIFVAIYLKNSGGGFSMFAERPIAILTTLIFPFLPALICSWRASSIEKKLYKMMREKKSTSEAGDTSKKEKSKKA